MTTLTKADLAAMGRVVVDGVAVKTAEAGAPAATSRAWPVTAHQLPRPRSLALERNEQREVVKVFQRFGARAESTSQTRRSRVALGIPDLWVWFLPQTFGAGWFEVKSGRDWRFSESQLDWAQACYLRGVLYGCGDRYAAEAFCLSLGLVLI